MATAARHPILYDIERWRRYRTWLLLPATVFALTAVFITLLRPASGGAFTYVLAAAGLYAFATSLWTRQRFTYLARDGDRLVFRTLALNSALGGGDIERARVLRLGAVFNRPDRRRLLPRPVDRWLDTSALVIDLRDGVDPRPLRRLVGPRCVLDRTLVVPVVDAAGLLAELHQHVCPPRQPTAAAPRRRGRRR